MRKIALISDGWKRLVTYSWVDGIMSYAKESGEEICLYHFNTNGNWSRDRKYNNGEYNLYTLPNYEEYDGIVFDGTNTTDQKQLEKIVSKLKTLQIPVVSISYAVDGFYYVGNNNKKLFRRMIDHLYQVHGCRDFVFAGGPDYNYENQMRYEAFKEAMEEYGLPAGEDRCLFGDFDFGTGVRYMQEWVEQKKKLPGAFVCANDNIAAGMCSAAEQLGYQIPRDFMVTGFDNLDKAAYYKPQISTVEHNRGNIGRAALMILQRVWKGEEVEPFHYFTSECIFAESCGCPNSGRVEYRDYAKWQIEYSVKREYEEEAVMELENHIAECNDYRKLFKNFAEYILSLSCDGVYIVVDKKLLEADMDTTFPTDGFDRKNMVIGYAAEKEGEVHIADAKELERYLDENGLQTFYMFSPIHFREQLVGYTILKNPAFLYENPYFYDVHSVFVSKLENLLKQTKLKNIYNRDPLTKLYNRVAYHEMIVPQFDKFQKQNLKCAMVFFDVDGFKEINDTYGHDFGDTVLKKIAGALEQNKPENGFAYRFGGDEFVVFFTDATMEKCYDFVQRVNNVLDPQQIHVSHGIIITDPKNNLTLDEYLVMADKKMYEVKCARKRKAKIKFLKGVDISSLPEHLDGGESFYTADGRCVDAFELLKENRINSVRLRIWNDPAQYAESKGYCDLKHTLEMARKIKAYGMHFMLDFHYSDYWADPGQQRKPHAWENLTLHELKDAVYAYTKEVLDTLEEHGCLPDIVQIGNEIRSGMLFPEGAVPNYQNLAGLINAGIRAVRDKSAEISVMVHLDQGGRFFCLKEWFDAVFEAGMEPIDAIGISFYSFWHGTFMDLKNSMEQLIERYHIPVFVVETAHPWRHCKNEHVSRELMKTAGLPAGEEEQKKSLELVMQIASMVSGKLPTGVYYWEPLCIPGKTYGSWDENMGMLDEHGKALRSFEAYRDFDPAHPPIDRLEEYINDLYVVDESMHVPVGTNLIPNGNFSEGLKDWWVSRKPEEVEVTVQNGEVYVSAKCNFTFELSSSVFIDKPGKYRLSAEYRGTNTTGVQVELFLKTISCNEQNEIIKTIFPSDVCFTTYCIDDVMLEIGQVQLGIRMNTPPIFGRIRNISLVETEKD
ncbi:MAG: glycosyl hydrolase 53 family protein [Lachnospiraceae bacterium]|nr:glycosyl hydrolase 53 family protein [Lachnospiraceae bacterium]